MYKDGSTSYNKNVGAHVEKHQDVELEDIYGTDMQNKNSKQFKSCGST